MQDTQDGLNTDTRPRWNPNYKWPGHVIRAASDRTDRWTLDSLRRTRTRPTASLKPRASHPPSLMLTDRLECEIAPFLTCVYCMLIAHLGTLPTSTITSQHNGLSSHYRKPFSDLSFGSSTASVPSSGTPKFVTSHGFDPFGATLAQAQGKLFRDPQLDIINPLPHEKMFIVS